MKIKKFAFILIVVLSVSLIGACSPKEIERKLDGIEESVEQKLDKTEEKIENAVKPNGNNEAPSTAKITAEQAQEIALTHAGFTAEQVTVLHVEYEFDDGIAQYDVKFYCNRVKYEYEINAKTGKIISFDMDD